MPSELAGKDTLIGAGSILSIAELEERLAAAGARVAVARSVGAAFKLLETREFDSVIIDHGLHNEAFDLCMELRGRRIPFIYSSTPHKLQAEAARRADAAHAAGRLAHIMRPADPPPAAMIAASSAQFDSRARASQS
jgi:PleD family two-component response regulator